MMTLPDDEDPEVMRWQAAVCEEFLIIQNQVIEALKKEIEQQTNQISGLLTKEAIVDARTMCVQHTVLEIRNILKRLDWDGSHK